MNVSDIINARLINQQIASSRFGHPEEVVKYMLAMQAQEYAMAKWAVGLRLPDSTDDLVEKAFNTGTILRTHIMRPTWHFVAPEDIRWMIALTAPRVNAVNAFMYRKCGIDNKTFSDCNDLLTNILKGGKHLTRAAIKTELDKKIITGDGVRLGCLMMKAELDGIICSGPRDGKQFTYALLEERVPPSKPLSKAESILEITKRYFASRGPAQLQDFVMWSGLTAKDAKTGIAELPAEFVHEQLEDKRYIYLPQAPDADKKIRSTFLMPDYDEYGMSYKDRSALFSSAPKIPENTKLSIPYNRMIVAHGQIVGSWKRTITDKKVAVDIDLFQQLNKEEQKEVKAAVNSYALFTGKTLS